MRMSFDIKGISFVLVRVGVAMVLLYAGWDKMIGGEMSINTFTMLGMEPYGRHVIGWFETISALLLLTHAWAHFGAVLGFSVMLGALIAHLTVLGFPVQQDNGLSLIMFLGVFLGTAWLQWVRRKQLPLIGEAL